MESRKIIIKSSEFNGVKTIMSSATTLAELKTDLDNAGISYRGMQFLEGISNTELKNDNSVLPHDVPYKGRVTNDLVFWLTKSEKNIASGLDVLSRQECYAYLKEHNLGEAVKEEFGKNYTQVDNLNLNAFINKHKNGSSKKEEPKKEEPKKSVKETKAKNANVNNSVVIDKFKEFIGYLEDEIFDVDNLDDDDDYFNMKNEILNLLGAFDGVEKVESPYSNDEIEDMFKDMI